MKAKPIKKTKLNKGRKPTEQSINLCGTITAIITPFYKGEVDYRSLKKLIKFQLDGGVEGIVVNGTTGESPTLEAKEVESIFKFVKSETSGQVKLLLGTGSNSTAETIKKTNMVKKLGADAALVVVPYYNKPTQRGLFAHFEAVAQKTGVPIVLYNVPGRTVVSMSEQVASDLAEIENVVGIKEASGSLDYLRNLKGKLKSDFSLLSGDDSSAIDFILTGGHGVISVISHVIPKEFSNLVRRAREGDLNTKGEYLSYLRLNQLLGIESNPIPVKAMLKEMGIIRSAELRLPLVEISDENHKYIRDELKKIGLI